MVEFREMFLLKSVRESENSTHITNNTSSDDFDLFSGNFIPYIFMGSLLIVSNASIVVNILRHSVLRAKNEYLLFAGM